MDKVAKILLVAISALFGSTSMQAVTSPREINLPDPANYSFQDVDEPEVKARVVRISFLLGEAKIKRSGVDEWERAVLNLPLVEGDEIATNGGTRIEIQLDKNSHIRLDENSFLRIVSLKDENIALSLSSGTLAVRLTEFDKDRAPFEIDAPKTTIALQRSGAYRIDAGRDGDSEIGVAVRGSGEARVYSDNAGFTLKDGRKARIFIDGPNIGEWSIGDAPSLNDAFERWAAERERSVAQSLSTAYYNQYYDNDIYGADDLNNDGEWVNISGYGQVWRPYSSSTNRYNDWSPYRYGQWRWMPPYGWIWVNDEPWGWATYHYGRWFNHSGRWYWSPYSYYRPRRSWWFPALVSINVFGGNTYWYPLSYRHRWRNYNAHYNIRDPRWGGGRPVDTGPVIRDPRALGGSRKEVPGEVDGVPIGGIVVTPTDTFGTGYKLYKRGDAELVKTALTGKQSNLERNVLPEYKDVSKRLTRDVVAEKPEVSISASAAKTGAAVRKGDAPLDRELRDKTILGGRPPRIDVTKQPGDPGNIRRPGVFERPPIKSSGEIIRDSPPREGREMKETPVRKVTPDRIEWPKEPSQPRYVPPPVRETPRYTPPFRETPKYTPPPSKPTRIEPPSPKRDSPLERRSPPPTKDGGEVRKKPN